MKQSLSLTIFILIINLSYCQSNDESFIKKISSKHWDTIFQIKPSYDIAEINLNGKTVMIFGTNHALKDPEDSMFANIQTSILKLKPSIILTEQYGSVNATEAETIKQFGDIGISKLLAIKNNIEIRSWDDNWNNTYNELVKIVTSNDIYVAMTSYPLFWYQAQPETTFHDYLSALNSGLEQIGYPFTPEQINNANYAQFFKNCFGRPFEFPTTEAYIDFISKNQKLKNINSSLQVIRELHFAYTLKEILQKHNRVFIQAGFAHVKSMKKIIELILENKILTKTSVAKTNTISSSQVKDFLQSNKKVQNTSFKKFNLGKGNAQVLVYNGEGESCEFNSKQHFDDLQKEIQAFKPTIVLTNGFSTMYETNDEIIKYSNDAELCRNVSIISGFTVNSWSSSWNDIYYGLNKKYSSKDLFFVGMSLSMLENKRKFSLYRSIEDYYDAIHRQLSAHGFPFQLNQLHYISFRSICPEYINDFFTVTSDRMFFDALQNALQKDSIAKIIADIMNIKTKALIEQIQKEFKPGAKLFIQVPAGLVDIELTTSN